MLKVKMLFHRCENCVNIKKEYEPVDCNCGYEHFICREYPEYKPERLHYQFGQKKWIVKTINPSKYRK
jgi:hypothetical protein